MRSKRNYIKKHPWLYRLNYASCTYFFDHPLGVEFENDWVKISNDSVTIAKGYAWDGCSYKWSILDLFVVGVPDGRLRYGLPITYHASLVHDALTQFRHTIPITHQQATAIFNGLLKESGFLWRHVYVFMLKKFGKKDFRGNG